MTHPKTDGLDALKISTTHFAKREDAKAQQRIEDYDNGWNDCINSLAQRGMILQEGWVAVPREPTTVMKINGQQKINQTLNTAKYLMNEAGEIYKAMLAAAPKMEEK